MEDTGSSLWPFSLLDQWWFSLSFEQQLIIQWTAALTAVVAVYVYLEWNDWRNLK